MLSTVHVIVDVVDRRRLLPPVLLLLCTFSESHNSLFSLFPVPFNASIDGMRRDD